MQKRDKLCFFRLSDLQLWNVFPLMYPDRGVLVRLNMSTTNAKINTVIGAIVDDKNSAANLPETAGSFFKLSQP